MNTLKSYKEKPIDKGLHNILKENSNLFHTFIRDCVDPIFSDDIKTAAVYFEPEGRCYKFAINKNFWDELNLFTKKFVLFHEILHIFLKHGNRGSNYLEEINEDNFKLLNIAQDICINEILFKEFGFRIEILNWDSELRYGIGI
jgi:predicted metal-dependent peptidase